MAPFGTVGASFVDQAVPAMSRCAHGTVVDEALNKLGADDAAGSAAAADVLDIGGVAVDLAVIAVGERQPPDLLANRLAGLDQPLGEFVIVREQARLMVAERDDDGTRQGRQDR